MPIAKVSTTSFERWCVANQSHWSLQQWGLQTKLKKHCKHLKSFLVLYNREKSWLIGEPRSQCIVVASLTYCCPNPLYSMVWRLPWRACICKWYLIESIGNSILWNLHGNIIRKHRRWWGWWYTSNKCSIYPRCWYHSSVKPSIN